MHHLPASDETGATFDTPRGPIQSRYYRVGDSLVHATAVLHPSGMFSWRKWRPVIERFVPGFTIPAGSV